jgi:DNA invertase Pin-like site-specific DNA recombinase
MQGKIIAYYRVSTKQQGASGLGLEAQQAAVEAYARQTGARIAAGYVEVESGKIADRPELAKALAHARRSKTTLCVAKLDRLSRNVEFLAKVMKNQNKHNKANNHDNYRGGVTAKHGMKSFLGIGCRREKKPIQLPGC